MYLPEAYTEFQWVEFAYARDNRVTRLPGLQAMSDIPKLMEQHNRTGVYWSVFRYDSQDVETARRWGEFYLDFDSNNLKLAATDASHAYLNLLELGLEENDVALFFSGKKGFHITVEPFALGVDPDRSLAEYYAEAARRVGTFDTLDTRVYDGRRMWRIPGSKHQATGLYKRRIPHEMLEHLDDLLRFAADPPSKKQQPVISPRPSAVAWWQDTVGDALIHKMEAKLASRKSTVTTEAIDYSQETLEKMKDLIAKHWPGTGSRHAFSLALAGILAKSGWVEDDTKVFITAVAHTAGDEEADIRSENVRTTFRRIRDGADTTGWPTIIELVGKDIADEIERFIRGEKT